MFYFQQCICNLRNCRIGSGRVANFNTKSTMSITWVLVKYFHQLHAATFVLFDILLEFIFIAINITLFISQIFQLSLVFVVLA